MNNARPSRILRWSYTVIGVVLLAGFSYVLAVASEAKGPLHRSVYFVPALAFFIWMLWLRAESRESLIASLIALLLVAAVFVAHIGGWLTR